MAKAKTHDKPARAAGGAKKALARPVTLSDGDVARRAYELYLARGCEHGHDVDDWLQAERECQQRPGPVVA
jgi:hypothetical protein